MCLLVFFGGGDFLFCMWSSGYVPIPNPGGRPPWRKEEGPPGGAGGAGVELSGLALHRLLKTDNEQSDKHNRVGNFLSLLLESCLLYSLATRACGWLS